MNTEKQGKRILQTSGMQRLNGTVLLKGWNSIVRSVSLRGKNANQTSQLSVRSAATASSSTLYGAGLTRSLSVTENVFQDTTAECTGTIFKFLARFAKNCFGRVSIGRKIRKRHVPVHVVSVCAVNKRADVYNIEVAECPEYFANGILVHNCVWAIRHLLVDGIRAAAGIAIRRRI